MKFWRLSTHIISQKIVEIHSNSFHSSDCNLKEVFNHTTFKWIYIYEVKIFHVRWAWRRNYTFWLIKSLSLHLPLFSKCIVSKKIQHCQILQLFNLPFWPVSATLSCTWKCNLRACLNSCNHVWDVLSSQFAWVPPMHGDLSCHLGHHIGFYNNISTREQTHTGKEDI